MNRWLSLGTCLLTLGVLASAAEAQTVQLNRGNPARNGFPAGGAGFTKGDLLRKFDNNRNGQLDPEEMETWRNSLTREEAAAAGARMPGSGMMKEELLRRFDINGNGRLDKEEKRLYREKPETEYRVDNWKDGEFLPPVVEKPRRTGPVIPRTGLSQMQKPN